MRVTPSALLSALLLATGPVAAQVPVPSPVSAAVPEALAAAAAARVEAAAALSAVAAALPLLHDLPYARTSSPSAAGFADFAGAAPAPWAPQDPADSLYRAAREALNAGNYARASELFSRITGEARFRNSEYRAVAFYYDALARSRVGGRAQLERARAALETMRAQHAAAWSNQRDAAPLLTRIEAELARQGDAAAARQVQARARTAARDACTDANAAVKVEALSALMQMDPARATPILEEVLKNRGTDACTSELRRRAIFIISQQRTERAAAVLLDAARNDADPEVRKQAVFFLGQVGGDEALSALQSVLAGSTQPEVRQAALFAISQHRSPRASELLRDFAMRSDVPADLRGQALFMIGQQGHGGPENARFLREVYPRLTDPDMRQKALFAIAQLRGDDTGEWLIARALDPSENLEVRKQALFFAGQQGLVPLSRLAQLYDRFSDRELKKYVLFVASQQPGDPQAVDLLLRIAREDQDPDARRQAIFLLGQSKDPRAAEYLLEIIRR